MRHSPRRSLAPVSPAHKVFRRPRPVGKRSPRLALEALEGRSMPAVFTVNTLDDTPEPMEDSVTLRWAIQQANAHDDPDTIRFGVSGTISLGSALPDLTGNLTITAGSAGVTRRPMKLLAAVDYRGPGYRGVVAELRCTSSP